MGGMLIEEDLLVSNRIIDKDTTNGKRINEFLSSRAQLLAGHIIDFKKFPVTFVLSDNNEPNAFYAPLYDIEEAQTHDDYRNIRTYKKPI